MGVGLAGYRKKEGGGSRNFQRKSSEEGIPWGWVGT